MSGAAAKTVEQTSGGRTQESVRGGASATPASAHAPGVRHSIQGLQRAVGNRTLANLLSDDSDRKGESLPEPVQTMFSRKFGQDLSHAKVHRDGKASEAVRTIGANAFARGGDLYFREGAFQPESSAGQALLAHELAHVVQQTRSAGPPATGHSVSEAHANSAAANHTRGSGVLNAGPAAPVAVTADNGVVYEDEELGASVLATRDEALDTIGDAEAEAQQRRDESGTTDVRTGHLDDQARALRQVLAPKPEKKGKSRGKQKQQQKQKAPEMPVSSPDLRDASMDEIRAHRRALIEAQLATTGPKEQETLGRDIENTTGAIDYAAKTINIVIDGHGVFGLREHQAAQLIGRMISDLHDDTQFLKQDVNRSHELRQSTSSLVTGPVHAYGGAWNEIEMQDFQDTNTQRLKAAEALKEGRLDDAVDLLRGSYYAYQSVNDRFSDYQAGIQKGGGRMVKLLSTVENVSKATIASWNPLAGAAYSFAVDTGQQAEMVHMGLIDKVDYVGNLKGALWNMAVGKFAGGAGKFAGGVSQPFIGSFGSQAVGFGTGILTTAGLTGTSPVDMVEDPSLWITMGLTHGLGIGGSVTADEESLPPSPGVFDAAPQEPVLQEPSPLVNAGAAPQQASPTTAMPATLPELLPLTGPAPTPVAPLSPTAASPVSASAVPQETVSQASPAPAVQDTPQVSAAPALDNTPSTSAAPGLEDTPATSPAPTPLDPAVTEGGPGGDGGSSGGGGQDPVEAEPTTDMRGKMMPDGSIRIVGNKGSRRGGKSGSASSKPARASKPRGAGKPGGAGKPVRGSKPSRAGKLRRNQFDKEFKQALDDASVKDHPLQGLLEPDPAGGLRFRKYTRTAMSSGRKQTGRYAGSDTGPIMHKGHVTSLASGAPQEFALEDADFNTTGGSTIESKGAFATKVSVLVALPDGTHAVPIELRTLQQLEVLGPAAGGVEPGTVDAALKYTAEVRGQQP